jgi:AraC family transcriptional regulator
MCPALRPMREPMVSARWSGNMRFVADQFANNVQTNGTNPPTVAVLRLHYLAKGLATLLETAQRELDSNREAAKASLVTASSILQLEIERRSGANGSRPGALAGWQIARVRAFIEQNLSGNIGARDLSTVAQLSPAHFSRSFKQAFGEPPHAYVIERRLEGACHLMITTSKSLTEIALSVGFSDQSHFCRHFQRAFGRSPSIWRRHHKSQDLISSADIEKNTKVAEIHKSEAPQSNQLGLNLDRTLLCVRKGTGDNGEACRRALGSEGFRGSVPRR